MRILHLGAFYPPHSVGGAERSVAALAEAQVHAGHDVTVACTSPGPFVEEARNGVRVFRMPHESLFWTEDVTQHGPLAYHWRKLAMPFNRGMRSHFERVLDTIRPDLLNSHSMIDVTTSCWTAASDRGIPIVHTLRDYDLLCADGAMYHGEKSCGLRCRMTTAAKRLHHRAVNAVVGISDTILATHLDQGLFAHVAKAHQRVIWNSARVKGIADCYRRPDRSGQPFTFGYLGRITEEKGVGVLLAAAQQLPTNGQWRMLIAGTIPQPNPFSSLAAQLPVTWPGHISPLDAFEMIDVLVVPSLWAEPFGRIVVEAYSAGVPVLAAQSGGLPDLIAGDRSRWLTPPGDVDALAKRLYELIAEGREALPSAETFAPVLVRTSPATMEAAYLNLYEQIA